MVFLSPSVKFRGLNILLILAPDQRIAVGEFGELYSCQKMPVKEKSIYTHYVYFQWAAAVVDL